MVQEQEAIKFNVTLPGLATDAFYVGRVTLRVFNDRHGTRTGDALKFKCSRTYTHACTHAPWQKVAAELKDQLLWGRHI